MLVQYNDWLDERVLDQNQRACFKVDVSFRKYDRKTRVNGVDAFIGESEDDDARWSWARLQRLPETAYVTHGGGALRPERGPRRRRAPDGCLPLRGRVTPRRSAQASCRWPPGSLREPQRCEGHGWSLAQPGRWDCA